MKTKNLIISCCFLIVAQGLFAQTQSCVGSNSTITINRGDVQEVPPKDPPVLPPPDPQFGDEKIIFWVHGLGGDASSWTKAANATTNGAVNHPDFRPRKAFSIRPTYTDFDMRNAAIDLHNQMVTMGLPLNNIFGSDPTKNFIIAHSQGGLVSRTVEKLLVDGDIAEEQRMYGGIVTFGTPHQGAKILNNTDPNGPDMASKFAVDACQELGIGPLVAKSEENFFLDLLTTRNMIEEVLSTVCTLGGNVVPFVFSDYTAGITEDYKVGSPTINALNQSSSNIPKVAFYGIEDDSDDGMVWRIMSSLKPQDPNSFDPFDANDDDAVGILMQQNLVEYQAKVTEYEDEMLQLSLDYGVPCDWLAWLTRFDDCLSADAYFWETKEKRDAYQRGVDWIGQANENYKFVIGQVWRETFTSYTCECDGYTFPTNDPNNCAAAGCELNGVHIRVVEHREESDGVVVASSASNYPGADHVIKLNNSNHQQMRNDNNTKESLKTLYDGVLGSFFVLDVR